MSNRWDRLTKLEKRIFELRLAQARPDIDASLQKLYGGRSDFAVWVERYVEIAREAYAQRPADLRDLDLQRVHEADWYQQSDMIGYSCYVDRFAGTLKGVQEKIPYLKELGVTYLHLMSLLQSHSAPNDGEYAVSDYRSVASDLGTMEDLTALAKELRYHGMSLCTDLVCNHTADNHEWAMQAKGGNETYQGYYHAFPDRTLPDQYEENLREIFPETAPGSFLYIEAMEQWVWSTFNRYQWDLNYGNPAVLGEMLDIILNLANNGVEIIRMDAVPFMWKQMGTTCENLPEAHGILQAFRALSRVVAPGLVFKAETIETPDNVVPYLGSGTFTDKECGIAYHNSFMVYLWSMLAEQSVVLSTYSLQQLPEMASAAAWVTYVRCPDDIGWAIMDDHAAAVGLNGFWHRSFLSDFYQGDFEGSFSCGDVFQYNPETKERRICGAGASLAGLENGVEQDDSYRIDLAVQRILLIHNMIFAVGGIPLIYMGDELGMTNNYSYLSDPELQDDSRWLQRPMMDWELAAQRHQANTPAGRIFQGLRHLSLARQKTPALHSAAASNAVWTHNDQLFGLIRQSPRGRILVLGNFSDRPQRVSSTRLDELGFGGDLIDQLTGQRFAGWMDVDVRPYGALWLKV